MINEDLGAGVSFPSTRHGRTFPAIHVFLLTALKRRKGG